MDAVSKGQIEAGMAEGMTNWQVFRHIVLPQAGRIALPSLSNNLVVTLKGTAIAFTIGVSELMGKMNIEVSNTYRYFECYAAVVIVYWGLVAAVTAIQKRWENRLERAYR
jgi:putative amino-acid transport system permease protein